FFIIGPVWYLCHYRGWISQNKDQVAIDMGAAIGMSVLVRGFLEHGLSQTLMAMPTLLCLALGASLAGWLYAIIERGGRK
ncbi:Lin0368 family putative glycerol transporter subunit, partial [Streptococcus ferus]|uniref:Lin0368 family putative glycerol transporter subunit n=1 Tax=Streptococcus ferus TaxID=1345 RepID=UPI00359F8B8A